MATFVLDTDTLSLYQRGHPRPRLRHLRMVDAGRLGRARDGALANPAEAARLVVARSRVAGHSARLLSPVLPLQRAGRRVDTINCAARLDARAQQWASGEDRKRASARIAAAC